MHQQAQAKEEQVRKGGDLSSHATLPASNRRLIVSRFGITTKLEP